MSGQIFLHCRAGKTLWVPSHTPSPNEKQPIHILARITPDELKKSFYLFNEEIQLIDNPRIAALVPNAKTLQEIHQAINTFRTKCHHDENFLFSMCYNSKDDVGVVSAPPHSGGAHTASANAPQNLSVAQAGGDPNGTNNALLNEMLAQYLKQQQQGAPSPAPTPTIGQTLNISCGVPLPADKPFASSGFMLPGGNVPTTFPSSSSASSTPLAPPQQSHMNPNELAGMLGNFSGGNAASAISSNLLNNTNPNLPYPSPQQNTSESSMLMYSRGYDGTGGSNTSSNSMLSASLQQQQQEMMRMMTMGMMPSSSSSSPMGGSESRNGAGLNYPYIPGYPPQSAAGGFGHGGGMLPLNNASPNNSGNSNMMMQGMGVRGGMANGRYYLDTSKSNNSTVMGNLIPGVGGVGNISGTPFSQPRYRNGPRMYGQHPYQMSVHSAALLKKGILEQKVHEAPEPIDQLIEGVEVPKKVAETYDSPTTTLVCATMHGARMTVWLRDPPKISPEELNKNGSVENAKASNNRLKKIGSSSAKEGGSKYVHCNGGIILMLKASFSEVEERKPVMLFPKQICTHFLIHGYCSRVSCLHEHHSEEQLRQIIAARHVQQKAMTKAERREMVKKIGSIEQENLIRFNEEKEARQKEDTSNVRQERQPQLSNSGAMENKGAHISYGPAPRPFNSTVEHQEKEKDEKQEKEKKAALGVIEEDEEDDDGSSSIFSSSDSDGDDEDGERNERKGKRYKFEDAVVEATVKKKEPVQKLSISRSSTSTSPSSADNFSSADDEDRTDEKDEEHEKKRVSGSSKSATQPSKEMQESAKERNEIMPEKETEKDKRKETSEMGGKKIDNMKVKSLEEEEYEEDIAATKGKKKNPSKNSKKGKSSEVETSDKEEEESGHEGKQEESSPSTKKRGRPAATGRRGPAKKGKK